MLQYTMVFTSYQHRRIGGYVQCMHALLHLILKRLSGGMPTLITSAFAAEHRASNGWKRADMSRFWTIAVTGVRFPARTCNVYAPTHLTHSSQLISSAMVLTLFAAV